MCRCTCGIANCTCLSWCPMKLHELLADFEGADPEESLEMLIDFSDKLPPLSAARASLTRASVTGAGLGESAQECRIQECQTAVYLWVELEHGLDSESPGDALVREG